MPQMAGAAKSRSSPGLNCPICGTCCAVRRVGAGSIDVGMPRFSSIRQPLWLESSSIARAMAFPAGRRRDHDPYHATRWQPPGSTGV